MKKFQIVLLYTMLIIDIAINIVMKLILRVPSEYYVLIMIITFTFATGIVILKYNDRW